MSIKKKQQRERRRRSIRKRLSGTAERPRLTVYRSARHIYAQVIDDRSGQTLVSVSSLSPEVREALNGKAKKDQAKAIGEAVAKACLARDIQQVAFDRNGYIYHGRVAAVAEGAREGGLNF